MIGRASSKEHAYGERGFSHRIVPPVVIDVDLVNAGGSGAIRPKNIFDRRTPEGRRRVHVDVQQATGSTATVLVINLFVARIDDVEVKVVFVFPLERDANVPASRVALSEQLLQIVIQRCLAGRGANKEITGSRKRPVAS